MKVLEVLLQSSGSLVERDTLLERVWGRVIVTPGTLTRLIAELRRLLGDGRLVCQFPERFRVVPCRGVTEAVTPRVRIGVPGHCKNPV